MKADGLIRMGVFLLAVTVVFSTVVDARRAGAGAGGTLEVPWGLLLAFGAFGLVGRHWFLARRAKKRSPRSWSRRRRALPPAPEPRDREPGP